LRTTISSVSKGTENTPFLCSSIHLYRYELFHSSSHPKCQVKSYSRLLFLSFNEHSYFIMGLSWQELGEKKRQSVLALIPPEWRIPGPLPSVEEQPDVTGAYIQQYLTPREIEITESNAVEIVSHTCTGSWTASEVVTAFCHRAALAHQLV